MEGFENLDIFSRQFYHFDFFSCSNRQTETKEAMLIKRCECIFINNLRRKCATMYVQNFSLCTTGNCLQETMIEKKIRQMYHMVRLDHSLNYPRVESCPTWVRDDAFKSTLQYTCRTESLPSTTSTHDALILILAASWVG